jgi:parvulin-like peptidyl-prolyl isomerase
MKKQLIIALVLLSACLTGCISGDDLIPLATAGKYSITAGEYRLKTKLYGINPANKKEAIEFVNLLINDYLVLEQAKSMKIRLNAGELKDEIESFAPEYASKETKKALKEAGISYHDWMRDIKEKILRKKTILAVMKDRIKIDQDEVKDFYWSNIVDFRRLKKVRVRQIVCESEEKAKQVQQLIMRGEPFDKLAEKYSVTSDSKNGGDLGYFSDGEMPAFINETVFNMKKGGISGIVKSAYGWHIFLCEDIQAAETPKYEEVKAEVLERFYDEKKDEYFNAWMEELRKKTPIVIHEKNIDKLLFPKEETK